MILRTMQNQLRLVAIGGLVISAVFGVAGTFVASNALRAGFWALDGTALVVATVILALRYFRAGCDGIAAGFLVYAIGEAVMLTGTSLAPEASAPAFAAGTALWAAGLLLTSVPREFATWSRITGVVAAILFASVSARIFAGAEITPLSRPLPFFAYPLLVLTFVGWIVSLARAERKFAQPAVAVLP
jgi:hypothetical protein